MAFSNVIEIYSQRNEKSSSVLYSSYLRKSTILLDMNEYSQCIETCTIGLSSLSSISTYDDDDLSIPKEVIEFVLSLYLSECQMHQNDYEVFSDKVDLWIECIQYNLAFSSSTVLSSRDCWDCEWCIFAFKKRNRSWRFFEGMVKTLFGILYIQSDVGRIIYFVWIIAFCI